jgi:hypothetical protein
MTNLRDARLKRALQAAPDSSATPAATTRRAIHDAAQQAVTKPRAAAWWQRLWPEPKGRMPWNTAFATVLLAVLVGMMWRDEDLPGRRQEATPPASPARVPASPPAAATATATAPPPGAAPERARTASRDTLSARNRLEKSTSRPAPGASIPTPPEMHLADRADAQAGVADSAKSASRDAAPAAEARTALAANPAAPAAAPAAPAQLQRAAVAPLEWTELRITANARSVLVPRSQAGDLGGAIQRLRASTNPAEPIATDPEVRIELLRDGERVAVLELAGEQVRVTDSGSPAPRTAHADARVVQQVRDEVARLFAR